MITPTRLIYLLRSLVELATASTLLICHHMLEKTLERRGRRLLKGGDDEDIRTITPTLMTTEDATTIARKDQSNEIRIGPITRARAKLLEQQVNLLLNESGTLIDENFILPKSMHLCMIRFVGETSMARGGEGLQEKPNMMIAHGCAREEREEGAIQAREIIEEKERSIRIDRSPEIQTDVDSSYELQIKQISTCWIDNSEIFPMSTSMSKRPRIIRPPHPG